MTDSILARFSVQGRSAIVTGGASGIGLAYAEAMAEGGAAVTIAGTDPVACEREASRLRDAGFDVRAVEVNVADEAGMARAFDEHAAIFGGLDIVFANAGIAPGSGYIATDGSRPSAGQVDQFDLEAWRSTVDVNLSGVFYTIRHGVRVMKQTGRRGSIIVTTSNASTITVPIVAAPYIATKAGAAHLVRQLARELAAFGIRLNAIAPGSFVTNIGNGHLKDPAVRALWDKGVPLGRMAETSQIKPLALYLASDASDFMTGAELVLDGGVSLVGFPG